MPIRSLLGALTFMAMALTSYAGVSVTYDDPDRFTDVADRNTDPRKAMDELAQHLRALGRRYLAPEANLAIHVIDLDRAGRPWRDLPTELRVVNGKLDAPCIELEWRLGTPPDASAPRRERICDRAFLRRLETGYSEHDPLVYEKRMLDTWFRARFAVNGK